MSDIRFDDFFDFNDKSQIEAGKQGIKDLEKAFLDFRNMIHGFSLDNIDKQLADVKRQAREAANGIRDLSIARKEHQKVLTDELNAVEGLRKADNELRATRKAAKESVDILAGSVDGLKLKLKSLEDQYNKLGIAERESAKGAHLAERYRETKKEINDLTAALRNGTQVFSAAKGSYDALDQETKKLVKDLKALEGGMDGTSKEAREMQRQIHENTQKLKEFDRGMNQNFRNVGNYKSALQGVGNAIVGFATGYLTISALTATMQKLFDTAVKLDSVKAVLNFVSGSAEGGAETFQFLRRTADELNLSLLSVAEGYKTLAGATYGTQFEGEKTRQVFTAVAKASAVLRISADDTIGVLKALGQIFSKGTVQAEELRGQLGDRLSGAFNLFAKGMGVTTAELDKLLKKGEVTSAALEGFAAQLEKTFDPGVAEAVDTLQGSINELNNTFTKAVNDGNIGSFFKVIIDGANSAIQGIEGMVDKLKEGWLWWVKVSGAQTDIAKQALAEDRANRINSMAQGQVDELRGAGVATGQRYIREAGGNTDALQSRLQAEQQRLQNLNGSRNYSLAYAKNPANTGQSVEDAIARYKELTREIFKQQEVVKTLEAAFNQATGKAITTVGIIEKLEAEIEALEKKRKQSTSEAEISKYNVQITAKQKQLDALLGKQDKEVQKRAKALEKQIRDADAILRASTEKKLAELDTQLAKDTFGKSEEEKTNILLKYEDNRYAIIMAGLEARQKLYHKASVEYKELEADKAKATADYEEGVTDTKEKELERRLKLQKKYAELEAEIAATKHETEGQRGEDAIRLQFAGDVSNDVELKRESAIHEFRMSMLWKQMAAVDTLYTEVEDKRERDLKRQAEVEKIKQQMYKETSDYQLWLAEFSSKKEADLKQQSIDLMVAIASQYNDLLGVQSDARIARFEYERDVELGLAGDNADAKKKIEEEYNQKIIAEKRKQAIANKVTALFEITMNTAVAASKVLRDVGLFGIPLLPLVLGLGALQAATVMAQPLPKYFKGRTGGPGELAIVNDQGPELVGKDGNYKILAGGKPTVTYLKPGDNVKTHDETKKMLFGKPEDYAAQNRFMDSLLAGTGVTMNQSTVMNEKLINAIIDNRMNEEALGKIIERAIGSIPVHVHQEDEFGSHKYTIKKGQRLQQLGGMTTIWGGNK